MSVNISENLKTWAAYQTNLADFAEAEFAEDIIEGIIPANSILLLSGDPKAGKSLVAQSWAHSVATGTPWFGRKVIGGGVAWVNPDGEHPKFLWERFSAIETLTGQPLAYGQNLAAIETFLVSDKAQCENLLEGVRAGLQLVVIDTLAAAAGSSNLSNQHEIAPIAEFAKRIIIEGSAHGTSVLWLHHTTKSDDQSVSGSQQITAFASQAYSVRAAGQGVILKLNKNRHGENGLEVPLSIESVELVNGRTSAAIVSGHANLKTPLRFRNALKTILTEGNYLPGEAIPKSTFIKDLLAQGISSSRAYESLTSAISDGLLVEHSSGKQMAYSFPISQNFPNEQMGESQTQFPPSPTSLDVGSGNVASDKESGLF